MANKPEGKLLDVLDLFQKAGVNTINQVSFFLKVCKKSDQTISAIADEIGLSKQANTTGKIVEKFVLSGLITKAQYIKTPGDGTRGKPVNMLLTKKGQQLRDRLLETIGKDFETMSAALALMKNKNLFALSHIQILAKIRDTPEQSFTQLSESTGLQPDTVRKAVESLTKRKLTSTKRQKGVRIALTRLTAKGVGVINGVIQ